MDGKMKQIKAGSARDYYVGIAKLSRQSASGKTPTGRGLRSRDAAPDSPLAGLAQPDPGPAAVLGNELDTSGF